VSLGLSAGAKSWANQANRPPFLSLFWSRAMPTHDQILASVSDHTRFIHAEFKKSGSQEAFFMEFIAPFVRELAHNSGQPFNGEADLISAHGAAIQVAEIAQAKALLRHEPAQEAINFEWAYAADVIFRDAMAKDTRWLADLESRFVWRTDVKQSIVKSWLQAGGSSTAIMSALLGDGELPFPVRGGTPAEQLYVIWNFLDQGISQEESFFQLQAERPKGSQRTISRLAFDQPRSFNAPDPAWRGLYLLWNDASETKALRKTLSPWIESMLAQALGNSLDGGAEPWLAAHQARIDGLGAFFAKTPSDAKLLQNQCVEDILAVSQAFEAWMDKNNPTPENAVHRPFPVILKQFEPDMWAGRSQVREGLVRWLVLDSLLLQKKSVAQQDKGYGLSPEALSLALCGEAALRGAIDLLDSLPAFAQRTVREKLKENGAVIQALMPANVWAVYHDQGWIAPLSSIAWEAQSPAVILQGLRIAKHSGQKIPLSKRLVSRMLSESLAGPSAWDSVAVFLSANNIPLAGTVPEKTALAKQARWLPDSAVSGWFRGQLLEVPGFGNIAQVSLSFSDNLRSQGRSDIASLWESASGPARARWEHNRIMQELLAAREQQACATSKESPLSSAVQPAPELSKRLKRRL